MKKVLLFAQFIGLFSLLLLSISDATAQWSISATDLTQSRNKLAGASAGGKAFFGGGFEGAVSSSKVDIYTLATNSWSEASLSENRGDLTATSSGDSVFFAGGGSLDLSGFSKRVDIYSVTNDSWSQGNLSESRSSLASAKSGRKVLFAGGIKLSGTVKTVDVYDLIDKTWSTAELSQSRSGLTGAAANGKIYFAGGYRSIGSYSTRVDIYDVAGNSWTQDNLSQARTGLASVVAGGKIYFAGGYRGAFTGGFSDRIDIYDIATNAWSQATLSRKRAYLTATTVGDKVFFAGGEALIPNTIFTEMVTTVDIYDMRTDTWSTADLSKKRKDLASASVGNKALFAGGFVGLLDGGSTVRVDIYTATAIDQQPTPGSSTVCQGSNVSTTITALGDELTYQWYKGEASTSGTLVDGQTSATLSLTGVQPSDSDSYYCKVNGLGGEAWSDAFTLTVTANPSAPVISMGGQSNLTVIQNTPYVSLTITGCEGGSVNWTGSNSTNGVSTSISVPTSATATFVYSATCTVGSCVSPAGSATVVVAPGTAVGNFDGYIYGADCGTFRGWAWDKNKINTPISVQILDGPNVIATIQADVFRQDLQTSGKGNGKHAFLFAIPESVKNNQPHFLSARITEGSFILKDSPKALICQGSGENPGNQLPKPPTPTVIISPLAAQVGVPFSATLVAFTDPEGTALLYDLTGLPNGLNINTMSREITGTPTQDGIFVLTYKATDAGGASNSVSFNLTVSPAVSSGVTGDFEGYLDKVECGSIRGWVWDRKKPNTPVTVEFYTGSDVWGSTVANIYRVDLKNAGKGNGIHAYSFEVPAALKDNVNRAIRARVQGSTYDLKDSGKLLQCTSAPNRMSAESAGNLNVVILGNPVKDQVEVEVRGAAGQPLRFALTDIQGRIIGERQIEKAAEVERQSFGISAHPSGLFFLKVSANGQFRTLKVVK